ncbi:MAG: hypothetical protein ACRD51_11180 [Candidatus Acidiferrum sp.]
MRIKLLGVFLFCFCLLSLGCRREKSPSVETKPSPISLADGQKAPEFHAIDQFGHEQSNQTLKGSAGTVLLFFRSADW